MILKRCLSTARALPVTGPEFIRALQQSWAGRSSTSLDLGLAVSGGVDSMALAVLCSRTIAWRGKAVAFVVDHAARPTSSEEADHIVDVLQRQLRIEAHKLTLEWPAGTVPLELPNFETAARKLRFRAMGRACAAMKIDRLLLGHHQDDQAETVFMRLSNGSANYGLRGMAPSHNVPECEGIYGVHESIAGGMDTMDSDILRHGDMWGPAPEIGGVRLARPLLSFSKDRLVATCNANNIEWVEDETNANPSLTVRNSVRHIFKSYSLPKAISETAMIKTSQRAALEQAAIDVEAERMFSMSTIRLDTRTGVLIVTLPEPGLIDLNTKTEQQRRRRRMAAIRYAKRLMMIVAPSETIAFDQAVVAVKAFFSSSLSSWFDTDEVTSNAAQDTIVSGGVLFQRLVGQTWRLTRKEPIAGSANDSNIHITKPADTQTPVLFDSRYWIRVRCDEIQVPLVIRLLRAYDIPEIRTYTKKTSGSSLLRRLEQVWSPEFHPKAPKSGDSKAKQRTRSGIPVIAIADDASLTTKANTDWQQRSDDPQAGLGPGAAVALPSLGLTLSGLFRHEWKWLQGLRYDVRYKKVDFGSHDKGEVLRRMKPIQPPTANRRPAAWS